MFTVYELAIDKSVHKKPRWWWWKYFSQGFKPELHKKVCDITTSTSIFFTIKSKLFFMWRTLLTTGPLCIYTKLIHQFFHQIYHQVWNLDIVQKWDQDMCLSIKPSNKVLESDVNFSLFFKAHAQHHQARCSQMIMPGWGMLALHGYISTGPHFDSLLCWCHATLSWPYQHLISTHFACFNGLNSFYCLIVIIK